VRQAGRPPPAVDLPLAVELHCITNPLSECTLSRDDGAGSQRGHRSCCTIRKCTIIQRQRNAAARV
jgi:hypothetical protein